MGRWGLREPCAKHWKRLEGGRQTGKLVNAERGQPDRQFRGPVWRHRLIAWVMGLEWRPPPERFRGKKPNEHQLAASKGP